MLSELEKRFLNDACEVLVGAFASNPSHETFLEKLDISDMANNYGANQESLAVEFHMLKRLIARKKHCHHIETPLHLAIML